jgi:hypothetical protein
MGWFDGVSVIGGERDRGHSHRRSSGSSSKKRHSSSRSIFGFGDDNHSSSHHNRSISSFFSFGTFPAPLEILIGFLPAISQDKSG